MTPRFQIISFRAQNHRTLLGFFNFVDNETGLLYVDWKLVQRTDGSGTFVSPPSQVWENSEGKKQHSNYVRIADKGENQKGRAWMDALHEVVAAHHSRIVTTPTGGPVARSARGPINRSSEPPF